MKILRSLAEWARAVAEMPVVGPLPVRTVLVPSERIAHALRRECSRAGLAHALAGTRFLTPVAAAAAVLGGAGVEFEPGEEGKRAARLAVLFRTGLVLRHFPIDLLKDKPGWNEAFAYTLGDLESAGLKADDIAGRDAPQQLRDVAAVWRAADEAASTSWTTPRILVEAARRLEETPEVWPFSGTTLAVASSALTAAQARFMRAIPNITAGMLAARPVRERHLRRVELLLGAEARAALVAAVLPRSAGSERDLLASYLFEPPAVLADPGRPRSAGPDGSVDLEEHAGVEQEVEATADWVARQVADGTPLEEIAVLVPSADPLVGLVADRLARLPWQGRALPLYIAEGVPFAATAAGARALAVVRGLREHLGGEALAALLPALRAEPEERRLSHGRATDLVWALGVAGGNAARPEGALDWVRRAGERDGELEEQIRRAAATDDDDPERPALARRHRDLERLLDDLRAVRPALTALGDVAARVVQDAPLSILWPALRDFLEGWLRQPGTGARVTALLDERLAALATDASCATLSGQEALRLVEETAAALRVRSGRFGEPAVYVGTVAGAAGLPFTAVRVLGLAEGHLPGVPREDPVVPDALRAALSEALPTAEDRALGALHALDAVVRGATARVALSAPRLDAERSMREPSSVLLEAAAALSRPNSATGERVTGIPDVTALRRDGFAPSRAAAQALRRRMPLSQAAWQDGVAGGALGLPPRWIGQRALDLARIAALLATDRGAGVMDGILGAGVPVPGLGVDWPISPSGLQRLLECPHHFLLSDLLGYDEPPAAPALREIGQPAYGGLFHRVAEQFYRKHGAAMTAREGTLDAWLAEAQRVADMAFTEFLREYPLLGTSVRDKERRRLVADLRDLVAYDWETGRRKFVAVEQAFGPLALTAGGASLVVRGRIDRIDVERDRTLIRDLKTGRAHPRVGAEADPDPVLDVQIAVYGLVARAAAAEWRTPERVAVAYAYFGRGHGERQYREDFHDVLEPAARGWLAAAAGLLAARAFPRTPRAGDCTWCPFRPVCGDAVYARAGRLLEGDDTALAAFRALKIADVEDED